MFILEHVESLDLDGHLSKEKISSKSFDSKLKDRVRINDGFDDGHIFEPIAVSWVPVPDKFFCEAYSLKSCPAFESNQLS